MRDKRIRPPSKSGSELFVVLMVIAAAAAGWFLFFQDGGGRPKRGVRVVEPTTARKPAATDQRTSQPLPQSAPPKQQPGPTQPVQAYPTAAPVVYAPRAPGRVPARRASPTPASAPGAATPAPAPAGGGSVVTTTSTRNEGLSPGGSIPGIHVPLATASPPKGYVDPNPDAGAPLGY